MKIFRFLISWLALVYFIAPVDARVLHGSAAPIPPSTAQSELSMKPPNGGGDYPFLNYFKTANGWQYGSGFSGIGALLPSDLDGNGYPLSTGQWVSHSGATLSFSVPSQAVLPGHWVFLWTGQAKILLGLSPNGVNVFSSSCSGGVGATAGNAIRCDNTGCSTFTGSIAVKTLTVTAAPTGTGCSLAAGMPISGANITVSKFGTPTIIIGSASLNSNLCSPACTGVGGTGTYAVNISQTAASSSVVGGVRIETNVTTPEVALTSDSWFINESATNSTASGLQGSNYAFIFNGTGGVGAGDEATYWASATPCGSGQACIVGSLFKQRVKTQGNFAVLRDLDWMSSGVANCTTWATRKPANYYTWGQTYEARNAPAGTTTYVAGGHTYTIPFPGQYVDATGTGASGGTVSAAQNTNATFTGIITPSASGTGSITSATVLNITANGNGFAVGQQITGTGVTAGTFITSFGTGSGGNGTYNITTSTTTGSETITGVAALHITALASGSITGIVSQQVNGVGVPSNTIITAAQTTLAGDLGTYTLNTSANIVSEAMTATQWVYSVTLGTGAPVDKQTLLILPPLTGDRSSLISIDGTTAVTIASATGAWPMGSTFVPTQGRLLAVTYDADFGRWLSFTDSNANGVYCGNVPPEIFIEINAELGTTPWLTLPFMTLDAMTDWVSGYATYLKATYTPPSKPIFEGPNEPFNCVAYPPNYMSVKSTLWINNDANHAWTNGGVGAFCGGSGNNYAEEGKILNTVGQDLNAVYGVGNYELLAPVQTYFGFSSVANQILRSDGFLGQSFAVQTGYNNTNPTYKIATRISVNNYWNSGWTGSGNTYWVKGLEEGAAYCYYNYSISAPCQGLYPSQAAVMTAYMNTSASPTYASVTASASQLLVQQQIWQNFGIGCSFGVGSRPAGCTVNQTVPLMNYEGGYAQSTVPSNVAGNADANSDIIQPVILPTTAAQAVFVIPNSGCVQGQSVVIAGLTGGTWSTANGTYTVQSATAAGCTLNLNSSGLGTFGSANTTATAGWVVGAQTITVASCTGVSSGQAVADATTGKFIGDVNTCVGTSLTLKQFQNSPFALNSGSNGDALVFSTATITYTGSGAWVNYLRATSYLAPELDSLTTTVYNQVTSNGGVNPSQYQLSSAGASIGNSNPWFVFAPDIIGYYPVGKSTSVTIASTTATLAGTITGVFRIGDLLFGGGALTANSIITGCTPIGANVCGTTSGDQLTLSQSSTVASGIVMTGNAIPGVPGSGTVSPVRAFNAICKWNGNPTAC